jgi:non-specific protein-tyrosine kinase
VAEYLGIEQAIGLTNVLIGQVALEDALQPWGRTGRLLVLPSGVLPPNPSELLGSHQMMELIATLEDRALVLLDAPPLLPVTDAAVIAAEASGALLVVRAKHTRREHVATALGNLSAVGAHVLGSVLNMAPTRGPDAYTYGYGYYGSYAANTAPESFPSVVPPRGVAVGAGPDATAAPRDALPPRSP